mmetsp:Transcript_4288/g.8461  ORF Transcript_4288/g.8461 Transcript_4288/m.8461 type:complete len:102 (-) Transcript_4288:2544-2849(-)
MKRKDSGSSTRNCSRARWISSLRFRISEDAFVFSSPQSTMLQCQLRFRPQYYRLLFMSPQEKGVRMDSLDACVVPSSDVRVDDAVLDSCTSIHIGDDKGES